MVEETKANKDAAKKLIFSILTDMLQASPIRLYFEEAGHVTTSMLLSAVYEEEQKENIVELYGLQYLKLMKSMQKTKLYLEIKEELC